jgi:hypothetical protein
MASTNIFAGLPQVSLLRAADMIVDFGSEQSIMLVAPPGVGKTSMFAMIADKMRETHDPVFLVAPNMDVPDTAVGMPDAEAKTIKFLVNEVFKLTGPTATKKPKLICIDELTKALPHMMPMWTTLIQDRTIAGTRLPDGSIVFATANHIGDGVGDRFPAHVINRITMLAVNVPTFLEWEPWAINARIHPNLIAWGGENSDVFTSYLQMPEDRDRNQKQREVAPMIFNPNAPAIMPFLSLRSMSKCSGFVAARETGKYTNDEILALLGGTVGAAAARSMLAFFNMVDKFTSFARIVADPMGVPVITEGAVPIVQINNAIGRITNEYELNQFMIFLNRFPRRELKQVFMDRAVNAKHLTTIAGQNRECLEYAASKQAAAMI